MTTASDLDALSTVAYRDIPGFPGYRVGDDGSVWSCWKQIAPVGCSGRGFASKISEEWRRLRPMRSGGKIPYLEVQLRRGGKGHHRSVHRLVLESFVGPCPEGMECCHGDGNPANNAVGNLRWDTSRNNQLDREKHGTDRRGEKQPAATLSDAQVLEIIPRVDAGENRSAIAREYGVSRYVISKIDRGATYRHLRA